MLQSKGILSGMEGAPKIPSPEDKKKTNEALRRAGSLLGTAVGTAIAAGSPIHKADMAPGTTPVEVTEKAAVRPEDIDDTALRAEIEKRSAVFKMNKDGELKRIAGKKEA